MYEKRKNEDENKLFDILNDVSTDFCSYPETELTRDELWNYRENLRDSLGSTSAKKTRKAFRFAAAGAAAFAALALVFVCLQPKDDDLRASGHTNYYSLSSMLGVNGGLEDYTLHIDENHPLKGGSVTLNSAVLDGICLSVSSTYYYEEMQELPRLTNGGWGRDYGSAFDRTDAFLFKPEPQSHESGSFNPTYIESKEKPYIQRLYIDGKEILCETESDLYASANGVLQDTASYYFDTKTISLPAHATLEIWKSPEDKSPETVFEFTLTEKNLVTDTTSVRLDQKATLPDGRTVHFKKFVHNIRGLYIEAEYSEDVISPEKKRPIYLECYDKSGIIQTLRERELEGNILVFTPDHINTLYSKIDSMDFLEFQIIAYVSDEKGNSGKRLRLDETVRVPL